jgi:hypothetical protein
MIYVLLIHRALPPDDPRFDADTREVLRRHRALQQEAAQRDELLAVARLDDTRAARTVRKRDAGYVVSDGPYLETKEWLVGFYLVDCADEATALSRAQQLCQDDGSVEIRPVTWQRVP